jgi:hypothetical protein
LLHVLRGHHFHCGLALLNADNALPGTQLAD